MGKLERGDIRWPHRDEYREALKAVLGCSDDAELGFVNPHAASQAIVGEMNRRKLLAGAGAAMGSAAIGPVVGEGVGANSFGSVGLELLRNRMAALINADQSDWLQIVDDYGADYYRLTPSMLVVQAADDLAAVQSVMRFDQSRASELLAVAAHLCVILAMSLTAVGESFTAKRWWRTAAAVAKQSKDDDVRIVVTAWEVVGACYRAEPAASVLARSQEVSQLALTRPPTSAAAGLWAGRAQLLALAGLNDDARRAIDHVTTIADRLPPATTGAVESLWGWPEHRTLHTQSFVYSHIGDQAAALLVQDQVESMYPESQARLRSQVQLHRSALLIREGYIPEGLRKAAEALDELPAHLHTDSLHSLVRNLLGSLPANERQRLDATELQARIRGSG